MLQDPGPPAEGEREALLLCWQTILLCISVRGRSITVLCVFGTKEEFHCMSPAVKCQCSVTVRRRNGHCPERGQLRKQAPSAC